MKDFSFKLELQLPFYSWTLDPRHEYQLSDIPFNGKSFNFINVNSDKTNEVMNVEVNWNQQISSENVDREQKIKLAQYGIDFLNYLIYHARTLDLKSELITLVSHRTVKDIYLTVENTSPEIIHERIELTESPPQEFLQLIEYTDFPETYDIFTDVLRDGELSILDINLLVDAYHAIFESRYSEAVIDCLTAIETRTFPQLSQWLKNSFFNKTETKAENHLIDMSFAIKMELLFGSVFPKVFATRSDLLENLKGINKLRNEIIHKGKRATKNQALHALTVSSEFLRIVTFEKDDEE